MKFHAILIILLCLSCKKDNETIKKTLNTETQSTWTREDFSEFNKVVKKTCDGKVVQTSLNEAVIIDFDNYMFGHGSKRKDGCNEFLFSMFTLTSSQITGESFEATSFLLDTFSFTKDSCDQQSNKVTEIPYYEFDLRGNTLTLSSPSVSNNECQVLTLILEKTKTQ